MFIEQFLKHLSERMNEGECSTPRKLSFQHLVEAIASFLQAPTAARNLMLRSAIDRTLDYTPNAWKSFTFPMGDWGESKIITNVDHAGKMVCLEDLANKRVFSVPCAGASLINVYVADETKALAFVSTAMVARALKSIHKARLGSARQCKIGYFNETYLVHSDVMGYELKSKELNGWIAAPAFKSDFVEIPEGTGLKEMIELDDLLIYAILQKLGFPHC